MENKPIYVTQPALAPLNEITEILQGVWERGILTHNGPLVQQLEKDLCAKIGLSHFALVTNGTIALQMAIRALGLKGEIITTPFSWIATISAIKWEGCTPIFSDIEPYTLNIDPKKIEAQITDKTVAIMPVHVFGNPCDVEAIQAIADKHNLKVIYDAAHAIGSTYKGQSLLDYGDISATSLHATKLFNTAEGGGCITTKPALHEKLKRIRFFGHDDTKAIVEDGFNGKMTEVHAALGLANLKYYNQVLADRKEKYLYYKKALSGVEFIEFQDLKLGDPNYSYFPIILDTEERLIKLETSLNKQNIFPRRYFYPSLDTLDYLNSMQFMPVSRDFSSRILCLPLFPQLTGIDQNRIIDIVKAEI